MAAILLLTTDDRHVGRIADGRQMAWTAIAIVETGEIGQAKARDLAFPRDQDSVSRFGMGMALAQVPAAWLAPRVEARWGAASSQPLFLLAPFAFVLAGAVAAAFAARELGGGPTAHRAAFLFASLASPLAAYAAVELSEPLQSASLAGAFAGSLRAVAGEGRSWRSAGFAGLCAGMAVLTKSSLVAVAPLALLPLVAAPGSSRRPLLGAAAAGALGPLALWGAFEAARFGHPFGGYAGETFSHPWLDGLWRLLVGPNFGLLWCFPAVILVPVAIRRAWVAGSPLRTLLVATPFVVLTGLTVIAAGWWAWHGIGPWGPRLLVPAIPLLASIAALEAERWSKAARSLLLLACVLLNLPPLLQHPTPVMDYRAACLWPVATEWDRGALPFFALRREGTVVRAYPDHALSRVAMASNHVVLPWFWNAQRLPGSDFATRLASPPWLASRPDITGPALSPDEARSLFRRAGFRFWGRGFRPDPGDADYAAVYDQGLANQVLRAQQLGRSETALALSRKLVTLAPSGFHTALLLESFRLLGQRSDAAEWLSSRPLSERAHPAINVVLALFERDAGNEAGARALLGTSARAYENSPVSRALAQPMAAWARDFGAMTADETLEMRRER